MYHKHTDVHGDQKKVSDFLELELQEVVSHLIWVLGHSFLMEEQQVPLKSSRVSFANDNVVLQHKKLDVPASFHHQNLIKESFP